MWCMNSFLESSDCTLQGTYSVTSHENTVCIYSVCDYIMVDVDIDNCCVL